MGSGIKSLTKETIIYGLGNVFYRSIAFFLLPVYLKYLSPTDYGTLESLGATRGLVVALIAMGLPNAVFRFYYRAKDEDERGRVISTIFFINLAVIIVVPLIFLWKHELISRLLLRSPEFGFLFAILAVNVFLVSFRGIPFSLLRAQKRALGYTTVNFTVSLITLVMNIVFVVYLKKGVSGVLLGNLCGGVVGIVMLFPTIIREIQFTFDRDICREILAFSVPLGLALLPLSIIFMADRYFIAHFASLHDLGIYALAYRFGNILKILVIMPFLLSWGPFVFSKESEKKAKVIYSQVTKYFVMVVLAFVVLISVMQIDIIKMLTKNTDYHEAIKIVPMICYAFFFMGFATVIRGVGIRITGKTYYTTAIMTFCMCFNLLMNYFLIRLYGVCGAAYSLLVTFIAVFILSYLSATKLYRIHYDILKISQFIIVSFLVVLFSQISNTPHFEYGSYIRIFLVILFFIYLYYSGLSKDQRKKLRLNNLFPRLRIRSISYFNKQPQIKL